MRATADTVVIGGGVMGCSTLFNLARLYRVGLRRQSIEPYGPVGSATF